jgi:UDP-GlcNAc:undecaprenyl-phosphate GlcNAc-1-phosphate transferase
MNDFMHSFFLLHAFHVTSLLAGSAIFFALFIILNETKKNYTNPRSKQIQNIHEKKITRLGGLGIFINLIFLNTAFDSFSFNLSNTIELLVCLLVFVPILITTLFEDFYIQLNPIYRLTAMIVSATIIFLIPGFNLPVIDFPFLDFIFNVPIIKMIIFSLLLIALMNGFNFIDGANGLMTITFLVAMGSIFTISYVVGDDLTMHLILILIGPFIIFFAFNYPLGRIFIGDIGAYLCGWLTGLICFSFFAKHER